MTYFCITINAHPHSGWFCVKHYLISLKRNSIALHGLKPHNKTTVLRSKSCEGGSFLSFLSKICLHGTIIKTTVLQGGVAEIPLEWRWCLWKITTSKILWPLAYLFWRYWHLYFSSANNPDIRKPPQNLPVAGWIFFTLWIGNPPCGRLSFYFYYTTSKYFCNTVIQT